MLNVPSFDVSLYRKNVGLVITKDDNGLVLVGKRGDSNNWQMPQGGINEGESEEAALFREMYEEVGLLEHDVSVLRKTTNYYFYDIPERVRKKTIGSRYIGQMQRWFLLNLVSDQSKINLFTGIDNEFTEWMWVQPEIAHSMIVFFKKDVYSAVLTEFNLL